MGKLACTFLIAGFKLLEKVCCRGLRNYQSRHRLTIFCLCSHSPPSRVFVIKRSKIFSRCLIFVLCVIVWAILSVRERFYEFNTTILLSVTSAVRSETAQKTRLNGKWIYSFNCNSRIYPVSKSFFYLFSRLTEFLLADNPGVFIVTCLKVFYSLMTMLELSLCCC